MFICQYNLPILKLLSYILQHASYFRQSIRSMEAQLPSTKEIITLQQFISTTVKQEYPHLKCLQQVDL